MNQPTIKPGSVPPARRASIRDVAKACGLSIATVSKSLNPANETRPVAAETRQRVIEVARQMGYRPDFAGRSLVSRSIRTIGVYVAPRPWANLGSIYEGPLFRGIEAACRAGGYDLLLINLAGPESIESCFQSILERRVMGLILIRVQAQGAWLTQLHQLTGSAVFLDAVNPAPTATAVVFDNLAAIRQAVEHLVSLGHRKIGFLGSCLAEHEADSYSKVRAQAFSQVIAEMRLPQNPAWVHDRTRCERQIRVEEEYCQAEGYLGVKSIMNSGGELPTAVIAYNNPAAWGALQYCHEHQIRVPQQLSLIAVDDSEMARMTNPRLTCIGHPLEAMGAASVDLLLQTQGAGYKPQHRMFGPQLIVRQSTAAPGARRA